MPLTSSNFEGFYYLHPGEVFILADHPSASKHIKDFPHLPAVNQKALEMFTELIHGKVTTEAKVALLKDAIKAL